MSAIKLTSLLATVAAVLAGLAACTAPAPKPHAPQVLDGKKSATDLSRIRERNDATRAEREGQPAMDTPPRQDGGVISEFYLQDRGGSEVGGLKPRAHSESSKTPADGKKTGKPGAGKVVMDLQNTSLRSILEAFLRDYLRKPYAFHDSFKDKQASLYLAADSRSELISMFDSFLALHGVSLKLSDGLYQARMDQAPLRPSKVDIGDAMGIFRLKFLEAKDFLAVAKNLLTKTDQATLLSAGNSVVVTASATEVRAVRSLVDELDIPYFRDKRVIIYGPRHLSAAGLITLIDSYMEQLGATGTKPNRLVEARPIPDLDRVVIVAANMTARHAIMEFLARTDVPSSNKRRLYQYSLTAQKAADVLPSVTELMKQVMKGIGEIKPVADKETNSLFFFATPDEYGEIKRLLQRFDLRPASVHIDITVAEVLLNDALQYGVEWFLRRSSNGLLGDVGTDLGQALLQGISLGVIGSGNNNFVALQLLSTVSTFAILSSPQIIVRNGVTAKIFVGGEEPVVKSILTTNSQTGGTNLPQTEFSTQKTGLELEVTPHVGNDGNVKLALGIKDIRISGEKIFRDARQPVLTNRELKTELVVGDGKTIFLGGIRDQRAATGTSKIPGVGDVRGVGNLFRNQNDTNQATELIILATPTVILDQQGADLVTDALTRALRTDLAPPAALSPRSF